MDLAVRQTEIERAAMAWFRLKRDKEHDHAVEFLKAEGTVAERHEIAARETARIGRDAEAEYETLKHVIRILETRASIGQSLLRAGRP